MCYPAHNTGHEVWVDLLLFLEILVNFLASRMPEAMCLTAMTSQIILPFFPLVQDTWASGHVFLITILPFAEI